MGDSCFLKRKIRFLKINFLINYGRKLITIGMAKYKIDWKNYKWKLISYISTEKLEAIGKPIKINYLTLWLIFSVFNGLVSFVLARSITSQKQANLDKLAAEKRYRILFERAGESIIVTKQDEPLMVNMRTTNLFEYRQEEILSMPIKALIHERDREKVVENRDKQFKENIESLVFESKIVTKSGKEKCAEIRSTKIEFGEDKALLYFFLDITERKKWK